MPEVRVSYSGQAYSPIGDKGRFALPPAFRKIVKEASGNTRTLCLDRHPTWPCLVGFGLNREEELLDLLEKRHEKALENGQDFDYDKESDELFGFERIPFDDSGRFTMPTWLQKAGKIEDGLFFRGAGRFFTVWAPAQLYTMAPEMERARIACETLVEEHGAKRK